MENIGIWKTIKLGFWLGIGFIIPSLIVMASGTVFTVMSIPSIMEASFEQSASLDDFNDSFSISDYTDNFDVTKNISVEHYQDKMNGKQLLILGSIINDGDQPASSIQLEAELLNSSGEFVYECSEYIQKELASGEIENFQIKCGCGKNPIPEYSSITVRVVGASNY
ncbi:MAG: hypothetical protein GQ547_07530 [Methylophaga sp.]|nr:hypothetical protein [Methylophaga sp.]